MSDHSMEKQDTPVQTTISESAFEDVIAVARLSGKNRSEWLRDLIMLCGSEHTRGGAVMAKVAGR